MRKFSQIKESKLDIQDNTINYISVDELKMYLQIANKYLSDEAKDVIDWLIVNNETYLHDLDPEMEADNALAAFYDQGIPSDTSLKELYRCIGILNKSNRLLEIPVFQTKEQFTKIINKQMSPDEILLDLKTEAGRKAVVEKYTPLIHKIVRQWINKSNLSVDDLMSVALEGLVLAMNSFGHNKVRPKNGGKWVEIETTEKTASYSFTQYAAYVMTNVIREEIKNNSHLVRIPTSQQSKERKEKGYNTKNMSISGDKSVGHDSDGNKTLFDYIDNGENGYKGIESEDLEKLWAYVYTKLGKSFKERDLDIFYSLFGLNGYKKIKGKEIASKYNVGSSTITTVKSKVIAFIKKDKTLWNVFKEILAIVGESKNNKYNEEDQYLEEHNFSFSNILNTNEE